MPPRKRGKGGEPPASGGGGGINALPDGVIQHILGFLDAKEAVRTCVLACRWRHLWQSASSLRILCQSLADVSAFLEHLLLLRAASPFDTFKLDFDLFEDDDVPRVHLWVRHALLCKARVLKLSSYLFPLADLPLVSQHLRQSHADSGDCGHDNCNACYGIEPENDSSCVLLEGLSEAENLSLIAGSKTFIFKRDLKQCPTFSKLRTLFLNDHWCVAPNFHELNCILRHSPVLETLSLHLTSKGSKPIFRIKGSWNPPEIAAAISGHLNIVEVKCEVIDDKVIKVVKFMSSFYISFRLDEVEILE